VTFEREVGEPLVVRNAIAVSDPDTAAQKAVFRALPEVGRTKYESVVVVLTRMRDVASGSTTSTD
jgi:hypothetical protein